jgi:hypothetical protein
LTFLFLSFLFDSSRDTVRNTFQQTYMILYRYIVRKKIINHLNFAERMRRGRWLFNLRATLFIDGTLTQTNAAPWRSLRTMMYSGKDKEECFSVIGIVDGMGKFLWHSPSYPGSNPDNVTCRFEDLKEFFKNISPSEACVADCGFHELSETHRNTIIPDRNTPKEANSLISEIRSLIECGWSGLKKYAFFEHFKLDWYLSTTMSDEVRVFL